jgi:flagellar biosynthesis regulator FlaF
VRKYNGKIVGILGTVIIHLIAAIIFMSFQLQGLKTKEKQIEKFEIEFAAIEEKKVVEKPVELPPTSVENILHDDVEMLNIARNLSSKSEEKIDAKDYIDKVKEELIESGKLGTDNYLDRQGGNNQMTEDDQYILENKEEKEKKEEKANDSQKMAANYHGPTRIYYDLQGRNHTYLPIPIYKCQGSGKVVLIIEVNQKGNVENASIMDGESTAKDECLIETAVSTALISRFEPNLNAPKIQKGTLTYIFVAQ